MKEHFTSKILVLIQIIFKEATPDRLDLILQVLYICLDKLCLEKCEIIHESVTIYISPYTETLKKSNFAINGTNVLITDQIASTKYTHNIFKKQLHYTQQKLPRDI